MRSQAQLAVIVLSGLVVASVTACGDDTGGGGGAGGSTSSTSSSSSPSSSSPSSSAASTPATTGSSSASSGSTGGGGEGGQLPTGDCFDNDDCEATQFCAFTSGRAVCESQDGEPGSCADRPTEDCPENYDPVCGCDGEIYGNYCAANAAGVDVGPGDCPALEGYATCDYRYCAEPAVCADGGDVDYRHPYCFALPDECAGPTCGGAGEGGGGAGVGGGGAGGSDACGDALSALCDQAGDTNGVVTECSEDASGLRIACDTDV